MGFHHDGEKCKHKSALLLLSTMDINKSSDRKKIQDRYPRCRSASTHGRRTLIGRYHHQSAS